MTLLALLLAMTGTGLLALSAVGLSRPGPVSVPPSDEACSMPSPDDSRRCTDHPGHAGWHHTEQAAWYGDVWAVDEHADTGLAAPPAASRTATVLAVRKAPPVMTVSGRPPLKFKVGAMGTRRPLDWRP